MKITTSRIAGFALLMLTGATAQAADIYCGGTISMLMADHRELHHHLLTLGEPQGVKK